MLFTIVNKHSKFVIRKLIEPAYAWPKRGVDLEWSSASNDP